MTGRRRSRRVAVGLAVAALALLLAVPVYRGVALRRLAHEVEGTPRDPGTGVVLGAGPVTLPPAAGAADRGAVLLLHGFVGSPRDFGDLPERLAAAGFHVRAPLLPGHGTSPRAFTGIDADSLVAAARAELAALQAAHDTVHLVGFSMGGALATLLAAEAPVGRVALVAPFYRVRHRWWYGLRPERWHALLGGLLPWAVKGDMWVQVNRPEGRAEIYSYRVIPAQGTAALLELGRRAADASLEGGIEEPVLLVHARGDMAADPAAALAAWQAMAGQTGAAVLFTDRSNHHLLHDHDREAAAAAVVQWLSTGRVAPPPGGSLLPGGG